MMNQDQYHASLLNKGKVGLGWDGVTKASQPKALPYEPPNATDPEQSILKVYDDDSKTIELCFNNVNLTDDQFDRSEPTLDTCLLRNIIISNDVIFNTWQVV